MCYVKYAGVYVSNQLHGACMRVTMQMLYTAAAVPLYHEQQDKAVTPVS
jgi:hypothetical protein